MNTTTHGCDHEGPCKISTVLSQNRGVRFLILGPEAPHVMVCSGRSGSPKCPVRPSVRPSVPPSVKLAPLGTFILIFSQ